jgi:hypothetical protein
VLTTSDLIAWLATLGIGPGLAVDLPVFPGPRLPKMPDELAVVTPISGPGEWMDGDGDVAGFQLRIRGRQDITGLSPTGEANALAADRLILRAPLPAPVVVGTENHLTVFRSGDVEVTHAGVALSRKQADELTEQAARHGVQLVDITPKG